MNNTFTILKAALFTFVVMLGFESTKEFFLTGVLSSWQSHSMTISFTTFMSIIVTTAVIKRIGALKQKELEIKLQEEQLNSLNQLKKEKLNSIKQVTQVAQHHVNNLASNLSIVQLELENEGALSQQTIESLNQAIATSTSELNKLGTLENPFDDASFQITFESGHDERRS